MALIFINKDTVPAYTALSSDIVGGDTIPGATLIGKTIFLLDTKDWFIIDNSLKLKTYSLPINITGDVTIGQVEQGDAGVDPWIMELKDSAGFTSRVSAMGAQLTSNVIRLDGGVFTGSTLDTTYWAKTVAAGNADATQVHNALVLSTGTQANGDVYVESRRNARYIGGSQNFFRSVARFPAVTGNCTRRLGVCDNTTNGFYFEVIGTALSVATRRATVETVVSSGFNGTLGSTYTIDENVRTFEIFYTNSKTWFYINGSLLHVVSGNTETLSDTLHLRCAFRIFNTDGNINENTLEIRVASINRIGELKTETMYKNITTGTNILRYGAGRLHKVIVNSKLGTSATVYDNTTNTGTKIATIDISTTSLGNYEYDCPFYNGLTVDIVGTGDLTIIFE